LALVYFVSFGELYANDLNHVVGRGETIYSISRFYSVSAEELMKVNSISDPSRLQIGQLLSIPAAENANLPSLGPAVSQTLVDYRVVKGNTLYSIARAHGITLQNLLELNKFVPNHVLKAGDVIKVPRIVKADPHPTTAASRLYSLRWPIAPKDISYMTGQMGVVVEGERLESVKSLTQGSVVSSGPWRKFGRVVIVETSGGYYYMYGGLDSLSVNVGDRITPGLEIGRLGINSVSEKPQLFFMVFRRDTPIDPAHAPRA